MCASVGVVAVVSAGGWVCASRGEVSGWGVGLICSLIHIGRVRRIKAFERCGEAVRYGMGIAQGLESARENEALDKIHRFDRGRIAWIDDGDGGQQHHAVRVY